MNTQDAVSQLCKTLAAKVVEFGQLGEVAADAEVDWKVARDVRKLLAKDAGEAKTEAAADSIATADPDVAALWRASLHATSHLVACREAIRSLHARIEVGRSKISTERAADSLHSQGYSGAA